MRWRTFLTPTIFGSEKASCGDILYIYVQNTIWQRSLFKQRDIMSYIDIKIMCAFFATIKYSYDT